MRILPTTTYPARIPSTRRHTPESGDYQCYRACLRWDFGFTCAFCLLHENDFVDGKGTSGLGLYWIEHRLPQKTHASERDDYDNCLYSCRLCNRSRGTTPVVDDRGRKLLDPTATVWAQHFSMRGDELVPRPDDHDAIFTEETYELNDPRKRRRRALRRSSLVEIRRTLDEGREQLAVLRGLVNKVSGTDRTQLVRAMAFMQERIGRALRELERFGAVPDDCDDACRCANSDHHTLPAWLLEQTFEPFPDAQ